MDRKDVFYIVDGAFYIDENGEAQPDRRVQNCYTFKLPLLMEKPNSREVGRFFVASEGPALSDRRHNYAEC